MSRYTFIIGLSALAVAAGPAFAQATAPGTVVPHHMAKASAAKMTPKMVSKASPDMSADSLNAKELASIQGAMPAPAMAPKPATKP
jgi:hypothetical protein